MVILCDGMARSGSTWSFNVVLKLLRAHTPHQKAFGLYSEDPVVFSSAVRPRSSHLVIKSHRLDPRVREICVQGLIRTVHTWRDPYDAVASIVGMFGDTVDHAINTVRHALRIRAFHQTTGTACIISYPSITTAPVATISQIACYLGLQVAPEEVRKIAGELSLDRMRRFSRHVSELPSPRLIHSYGKTFDRETMLHQDHIRNGSCGYGRRVLDPEHIAAIDAMLREEGFAEIASRQRSQHRIFNAIFSQV
jgi:hypothetical protein